MTNARSIHIGLNQLDPDAYNGWDGALSGCINDARDMQAIADSLGYQSMLLTDSEATSWRVISEIGQASTDLSAGDILFLSYSGHGGQVDDVNGDEKDALDETWCLWDRQLIDDELYALWGQFEPGVRIVMLSDSCHSGTVARMLATMQALSRDVTRARSAAGTKSDITALQTTALDSLSKTLSFETVDSATKGTSASPGPSIQAAPRRPKRIPPDIQNVINNTHADIHAAAQWLAGPSEKAVIGATVILISGCQDNQLSADGAGNGLFTQRLKQAWNNGTFSGNYRAFTSAIRSLMPRDQQPNYFTVGAKNPAFEAQSPFDIRGGNGVAVPPPGGQPPHDGERVTLRQGSTGPNVKYLQSRLQDYGYHLNVDGLFGALTTSSVRSFQTSCGLIADGVVGHDTWVALG